MPTNEILDELKEVDLHQISVNPFQPRREFALLELEELAASIREVGLLHPPLVRITSDPGRFELVSGERRFRAAQIAGLLKIPVVIRSASNRHSAQAALIENVQRVDLNPLEIAKALRNLSTEFGMNQEELSHKIGKKRSTIANYLRLLGLPQVIQDSLSKNLITMGHAKAILSLEESEKQYLLHELVLRDDLTVRQTEEAANRIAEKAKEKKLVSTTRDFFLDEIRDKLQHRLGTKVIIEGKGKKGRIMIDYYNLDDLDRLLTHFDINIS